MGTVVIAGFSLVVSMFGVLIATFAWIANAEKLRLDLYDRRYAIYRATLHCYRILMTPDYLPPDVCREAMDDLVAASRQSQFLFAPGSGVSVMLDALVRTGGILKRQEARLGGRETLFREAQELWQASMKPLEAKMAPYLSFHYLSLWESFAQRLPRFDFGSESLIGVLVGTIGLASG